MATDPDEMWKPGYSGPEPVARVVVDDRPDEHSAVPTRSDGGVGPHRTSRAWPMIAVAVAVIVIAGMIVVAGVIVVRSGGPAGWADEASPIERDDDLVRTGDGEAMAAVAERDRFAGAVPRRLPDNVEERWRFRLDSGDLVTDRPVDINARLDIVDSRFVVAVAGSRSISLRQSKMTLIDAVDGTPIWSRDVDVDVGSVRILGATDTVLVAQTLFRVVGYDLATGESSWSVAETTSLSDEIGPAGGFEILPGTEVLARRPNLATNPTVLYDVSSGDEVGRIDGPIVGTDELGTYYAVVDGVVRGYELSVGWSGSSPLSSATSVDGDDAVVVDGRLLTLEEGRLLIKDETSAADGPMEVADSGEIELPRVINAATAMAGRTLLIGGAGGIVGVELDGEVIRPRWSRPGVATQLAQTDRGTVVLVAQQGGARHTVVDGNTGVIITTLTMTTGMFDALEFAANGVLALKTSSGGTRIAAIDLIGNEIWSLPGEERVALGDGIVARLEVTTDAATVVAFGR